MKNFRIFCLFFICTQLPGISATNILPPLQPIGQVDSMENYSSNVTSLADPFAAAPSVNSEVSPDLTKIEQTLFGRAFVNQNITVRLSRVEKSLFNTTYPNVAYKQRIDNIVANFNQMSKFPNISKNVLSRMETKVFNQTFPQGSSEKRIERLEQQIFGAVQSGDVSARYQALQIATKNYRNIINNQNAFVNQRPGGLRSIVGNLGGSLMGGSMTGFTPPINPAYANYPGSYNGCDNYMDNYTSANNGYGNYNSMPRRGSGIYRGYRSNNGMGGYSYHDSFNDYGTGTGVTILD